MDWFYFINNAAAKKPETVEKPRVPAVKKAAKSDEPPVAPEEVGGKKESTQGEVCVCVCVHVCMCVCLRCFLLFRTEVSQFFNIPMSTETYLGIALSCILDI